MIDLHNHLLPGIDDGPSTMADAVEMARVAVREGITTMVCTPHISHARYDVRPRDVVLAVESMRTELEHREVPLTLLPGAEFTLEAVVRCTDEELRMVSLGGGGRWLLVELPFKGWPLDLHDVLDALEMRGFGVVLAHPERNESVQSSPDRMRDLVGRGALVQVTAWSLMGENGPRAKRAAEDLLRNGFAHFIASDAHSASRRPPGLLQGVAAAAAALGVNPGALRWMVDEGPRLVTEGQVVRAPRFGAPSPRRRPAAPAR